MKRETRAAFTLVELLVVMVIIGLLLGFILTAALDGRRRAEEEATRGLIAKLESGLMDRVQALMEQRADRTDAHLYIARNFTIPPSVSSTNLQMLAFQRAQCIAQYDYIRAELPDTFLVDTTNAAYPVNFAGIPYPGFGGTTANNVASLLPALAAYAPFVLPLGSAQDDNPAAQSFGGLNASNPAGTGIYGASYQARAALYKNLGGNPTGFDGLDNNSNGLIDELAEQGGPAVQAAVLANLAKHQPNTARAEVLYAILVEGQGPLGAAFQADDFNDRQVRDTDGDGLPEFIDAWGNPIQFYRWPILYHSDLQVGQRVTLPGGPLVTFNQPYDPGPPVPGQPPPPTGLIFAQREQDPLDPNQQLVAPSWWNQGGGCSFFESYFHLLRDPTATSPTPSTYGRLWDRSANAVLGLYPRRAFYAKFLIASGGPDGQLGIYQTPAGSITPANLVLEGNALRADATAYYGASNFANVSSQATVDLQGAGQDDITNHKPTR